MSNDIITKVKLAKSASIPLGKRSRHHKEQRTCCNGTGTWIKQGKIILANTKDIAAGGKAR